MTYFVHDQTSEIRFLGHGRAAKATWIPREEMAKEETHD